MKALGFGFVLLGLQVRGTLGLAVPSGEVLGERTEDLEVIDDPYQGSLANDFIDDDFIDSGEELDLLDRYPGISHRNVFPNSFPPDYDFQPPDLSWDENVEARKVSPNAYPEKLEPRTSDAESLAARDVVPLEIISFNMQPDVGDDDPIKLRKNPSRRHREFFCHWRTPKDGLDLTWPYQKFQEYIKTWDNDWCSGPGGFCTPVLCTRGYLVSVCHWSDVPWQVPCLDIFRYARDLVIALNNRTPDGWENGVVIDKQPPRSPREKLNDQKKLCIDHSSVYTPEMLGYTWHNTNPFFQVQLSFGIPDERIPCDPQDQLREDVKGPNKTQEWYMKNWYGSGWFEEDFKSSTSGAPAAPTGNKPGGPVPLPVAPPPPPSSNGTSQGPQAGIPDLEFIPANLRDQYLYEQAQKKCGEKCNYKMTPTITPPDDIRKTTRVAGSSKSHRVTERPTALNTGPKDEDSTKKTGVTPSPSRVQAINTAVPTAATSSGALSTSATDSQATSNTVSSVPAARANLSSSEAGPDTTTERPDSTVTSNTSVINTVSPLVNSVNPPASTSASSTSATSTPPATSEAAPPPPPTPRPSPTLHTQEVS